MKKSNGTSRPQPVVPDDGEDIIDWELSSTPEKVAESQNRVKREDGHDNFTMMPNLIDALGLSVYAYRLYAHIRMIVTRSEKNECTESNRTMADECNMSVGSVVKAKQELKQIGLVKIRTLLDPKTKQKSCEITICDVWLANYFYHNLKREIHRREQEKEGGCSCGEHPCSCGDTRCSCGDLNKEYLKTIVNGKQLALLTKELQLLQKLLRVDGEDSQPVNSQPASPLGDNALSQTFHPAQKGASPSTSQVGVEPMTSIDYAKMVEDAPSDLSKHDLTDWFYQRLQYVLGDRAYEKAVELSAQKMPNAPRQKHSVETLRANYANAGARGVSETQKVLDRIYALFKVRFKPYRQDVQDLVGFLREREAKGESLELFARWWYTDPVSWRGQKGQPPEVAHIQQFWGQAFDASRSPALPAQPKVTICADGGAYV